MAPATGSWSRVRSIGEVRPRVARAVIGALRVRRASSRGGPRVRPSTKV